MGTEAQESPRESMWPGSHGAELKRLRGTARVGPRAGATKQRKIAGRSDRRHDEPPKRAAEQQVDDVRVLLDISIACLFVDANILIGRYYG